MNTGQELKLNQMIQVIGLFDMNKSSLDTEMTTQLPEQEVEMDVFKNVPMIHVFCVRELSVVDLNPLHKGVERDDFRRFLLFLFY